MKLEVGKVYQIEVSSEDDQISIEFRDSIVMITEVDDSVEIITNSVKLTAYMRAIHAVKI